MIIYKRKQTVNITYSRPVIHPLHQSDFVTRGAGTSIFLNRPDIYVPYNLLAFFTIQHARPILYKMILYEKSLAFRRSSNK